MSRTATSGWNSPRARSAVGPSSAVDDVMAERAQRLREHLHRVGVVVDDEHAQRTPRAGAAASRGAGARGGESATAAALASGKRHDELGALAEAARSSPRPGRRASSTRLRTSVRPMPRPPCARSGVWGLWTNGSKMRGQDRGRRCPCRRRARGWRPCRRRSRRGRRCARRDRCTLQRSRGGSRRSARAGSDRRRPEPRCRHVDARGDAQRCSMSGLAISIARATMLATSTLCRFELDLAARDARDVEQVVDEPGEVVDLALDDLATRGSSSPAHAHQLERGDDRRERIAELVAEHREELVLPLLRLASDLRRRLWRWPRCSGAASRAAHSRARSPPARRYRRRAARAPT